MRYRVQISFDYDMFCVTTRELYSRRRAELWARKIMLLSNADACRVLASGGEAVTLFVRDTRVCSQKYPALAVPRANADWYQSASGPSRNCGHQ